MLSTMLNTLLLYPDHPYGLLENPEQTERPRKDPTLIKSAIEELLRYNGPLETATERYARGKMWKFAEL